MILLVRKLRHRKVNFILTQQIIGTSSLFSSGIFAPPATFYSEKFLSCKKLKSINIFFIFIHQLLNFATSNLYHIYFWTIWQFTAQFSICFLAVSQMPFITIPASLLLPHPHSQFSIQIKICAFQSLSLEESTLWSLFLAIFSWCWLLLKHPRKLSCSIYYILHLFLFVSSLLNSGWTFCSQLSCVCLL